MPQVFALINFDFPIRLVSSKYPQFCAGSHRERNVDFPTPLPDLSTGTCSQSMRLLQQGRSRCSSCATAASRSRAPKNRQKDFQTPCVSTCLSSELRREVSIPYFPLPSSTPRTRCFARFSHTHARSCSRRRNMNCVSVPVMCVVCV